MRLLGVVVLGVLAPISAFAQGGAAVPVTLAVVQRQDVPVLQKAIGTVQAFQSVLIRARVDGTLDRVLFTEGQLVKPGDLLAQLDPRPYQAVLDQMVAKRAADDAMLSNARGDLVRYNDLAASQIASRQKLDQTRAAVQQAEAAVRGDEAQIAAAQLNLDFTRITSPLAGRVGLRQIDPGNYIRAADPNAAGLVTVAQIQPIALLFTLPQDMLPQVQAAMKRGGRLPVVAYNGDDTVKLSEGQLLTVDSIIDASTGTIKLKAVFANTDDHLWPGQFVNVRMQLSVQMGAATVPSAAVQRGQTGLYVFAVKDGAAAVRAIEVAQDDGKVAVVTKGLEAGEQVVLSGQSRLTNGTKVSAIEPKPAS